MVSEISKGKKLWQGALYLSLAAILIKILSAIYRVIFQNIVGDIGFYIYQQIYPIYGIAIMLSTYGFPVIISKLISEKAYSRNEIVKSAIYCLSIIGIVNFSLFFLNATWLANIMGDEKLATPIQTIAFIFLAIPLLSVLRGFFQGQGEMLPTAVSQITEQSFRVIAILLFSYIFIINGYGVYAAGTGAALGSIMGSFFGFFILLFFYQKQEKFTAKSLHKNKLSFPLMKIILFQGIMICFSSLLLILFQLVDALTVLRILVENGVEIEAAKVAKGVFDRGQPLIQMGTVITTSFSLVVVPLIARLYATGQQELIKKYSSLAFRISFLLGAAASIGLAIIIKPTNIMLFKDGTDSLILGVMGLSIFFASVFLTTSAILHGLNKVRMTVFYVFVGVIVKVLLNVFLIPVIGTLGAATATVIASAFSASLNIVLLVKLNVLPLVSVTRASKAAISLIAMGVGTFFWKKGGYLLLNEEVGSRLGSTMIAITSAGIGALFFLISLIATKLFTEDELEQIPKIRKLAVFMQSRKSK